VIPLADHRLGGKGSPKRREEKGPSPLAVTITTPEGKKKRSRGRRTREIDLIESCRASRKGLRKTGRARAREEKKQPREPFGLRLGWEKTDAKSLELRTEARGKSLKSRKKTPSPMFCQRPLAEGSCGVAASLAKTDWGNTCLPQQASQSEG